MANKGPRHHQKRKSSPASQNLRVKDHVFTYAYKSGPHEKALSLPLGVVLRDKLGVTKNAKETRACLLSDSVKVNGEIRRDARFVTGLFDILEIGKNQSYRVLIDQKGRLVFRELKTAGVVIAKIKSKKAIRNNRIALSLSNGRTLELEKTTLRAGDSVALSVSDWKITRELPLEKDATVLLLGGKHVGRLAVISNATTPAWHKPQLLTLQSKDGETFQTVAKNVVVVGADQPVIDEVAGDRAL